MPKNPSTKHRPLKMNGHLPVKSSFRAKREWCMRLSTNLDVLLCARLAFFQADFCPLLQFPCQADTLAVSWSLGLRRLLANSRKALSAPSHWAPESKIQSYDKRPVGDQTGANNRHGGFELTPEIRRNDGIW